MLLTLLGRECPGLAAQALFSDLEIQVLKAQAKKKGFVAIVESRRKEMRGRPVDQAARL
jgi:hypothetical protein